VELTEKSSNNSKVPRRLGFGTVVGIALFSATRAFAAVNASPSWIKGVVWFSLCGGLLVAAVWLWEYTQKRHWVIRMALSVVVVGLIFFLAYSPVRDQYRREHPFLPEQATSIKTEPSRQAPVPSPNPTLPADIRTPAAHYKRHTSNNQSSGNQDPVTRRMGDNNTIVNTPVSPNMGSGNTIVGPTDANGNTIYNRGGTAIGSGACADSTSIAIGAGANGGNCPVPPPK